MKIMPKYRKITSEVRNDMMRVIEVTFHKKVWNEVRYALIEIGDVERLEYHPVFMLRDMIAGISE